MSNHVNGGLVMRCSLFLVVAVLLSVACTKLDYIGEEYAPTHNVDLYFSEADIDAEYKVMGRIIATAGEFVSSDKMMKKIMEKAKEKGADAILFIGLDRFTTVGPTSYSEVTKTKEKGGKTVTTTTGTSSTPTEDKKQVEAVFLKYK